MGSFRKNVYVMPAMMLALSWAFVTSAQTYRGRVEGLVTDESSAVIAAATVTLTNVNTAVEVVRKTSDTGLYVFDGVDPGSYSITLKAPGFSTFTQENILVQTGGDITVNAVLKPGSVTSSVTVTEAPVAVEFNSSSKGLTIDTKMAEETPRLDRNPFKLSLLEPSAINTRGEMQPFNSWSMNSVDLGGGTNLKNDLQVDGAPIGVGHKGSYPPNTDAVQEVVVSQNSVDAETGHSAGGAITMTTKSGTNDWHGTGFYVGRYPWLSAEADRTRGSYNAQRQQVFGGTLGNPIIKRKLFSFFSVEDWKVAYPNAYNTTVPTALEKAGDFSQTYNVDGGLRGIYDPWTSRVNTTTGAVTVQPFPGNKIPQNRFDAVTGALLPKFWAPNNPGDNITGVNNYKKGFTDNYNYYNWSERLDYNLSDKWKFFGRVSRDYTTDIAGNPTPDPNTILYLPTGTERGAWQATGDATWTVNPRTVVDVHGDWHQLIDALSTLPVSGANWNALWPNNDWYSTFTKANTGIPLYLPRLVTINSQNYSSYVGNGSYWDQRPKGMSLNGKISQQRGSHYMKAGVEYRRSYGVSYVSRTPDFWFDSSLTANTFSNPDTLHYGDEWATFMLGALNNESVMVGGPAPDPHAGYFGMYFQDDWKVSKRVTLNLGLRNDYETAWWDPAHNFSKGLDLTQPIPEMVANPPVVPSQVSGIAGASPWKYNGQWVWTSGGSAGMWNAPKLALQPRVGIAVRIDDKTSLRAGYARYTIPTEFNISGFPNFETVSFLEPPYFGVTQYQSPLNPLQGVPQSTFANPFPSSNPLLPILGRNQGGAVGRGQNGSLLWYKQDLQKPYNDRFNLTFQHELPHQVVAMASFFMNFGHLQYAQSLNTINPQYELQYQNTLSQNVANPFYHYLNTGVMPGPLYNQQTVSLASLLVPYPQYSGLAEFGQCCAGERYHSLELKAQRAFSNGWNFLFSYVYIREQSQIYFNDMDVYSNHLVWQDSDQPHHRFSAASTWDIPIGRKRTYLNNLPKAADFMLGGWQLVGVLTRTSGDNPRFNNGYPPSTSAGMLVVGNPCISNPTPQHWFNTAAFAQLPANTYQLRTNPLQFGCLVGPGFFNLDATLSKSFAITEKVHVEFKLAAYNATNTLNLGDPNTDIHSSQFGQALYQGSPGGTFGQQAASYGTGNSGRQLELNLKVIF